MASLSAVAPGPPVLGGDSSIATGTWTVPADGGGGAKKLIAGSWSTVITRSLTGRNHDNYHHVIWVSDEPARGADG